MRRGQQKCIRAFTVSQRSYHLIGGYNFWTDQVFCQAVECKNSQTFFQFLEYLLVECCPTQKIVLVMDKVSYHRSKTARAALSLLEPRTRVFWLPKYCPQLNLIERFWRHLKDLACSNKFDLSIDSLADRIRIILENQNSSDQVLKMSFLKNFV